MGLKIRKALNYAENDNSQPMHIHKRQSRLLINLRSALLFLHTKNEGLGQVYKNLYKFKLA